MRVHLGSVSWNLLVTDNCYKLLKSLHLIGWEQICQWKTKNNCQNTWWNAPPPPLVHLGKPGGSCSTFQSAIGVWDGDGGGGANMCATPKKQQQQQQQQMNRSHPPMQSAL